MILVPSKKDNEGSVGVSHVPGDAKSRPHFNVPNHQYPLNSASFPNPSIIDTRPGGLDGKHRNNML